MVIRCDSCGTPFRFDRMLIEGYRGARIRCRRCGHSIDVSVPSDPPAPRDHPVRGLRAAPGESFPSPFPASSPQGARIQSPAQATRSAALAFPIAEIAEDVTEGAAPDNLVDFLRFRDSNRPRSIPDVQDISGRISPEIPVAVPGAAETPAEIPAIDASAPRVPKDSHARGESRILEEEFLWRVPEPREKSIVYPTVKATVVFTLLMTLAFYLGFHLILALASWAIG